MIHSAYLVAPRHVDHCSVATLSLSVAAGKHLTGMIFTQPIARNNLPLTTRFNSLASQPLRLSRAVSLMKNHRSLYGQYMFY
ncbi:IS1 family transposase [Edwardsiella hoshinae]|uniref:IS1 family transposase n=1 Tax=Edwardsiella hoshinae TaxID=93378 RepID=UPI0009F2CD02